MTSVSQNPTLVFLVLAAVMVVLGTFVDSLAVLLIFAPVRDPDQQDSRRHVWWFMLPETIVMLLLIFIPGLAAWLPHYFLG